MPVSGCLGSCHCAVSLDDKYITTEFEIGLEVGIYCWHCFYWIHCGQKLGMWESDEWTSKAPKLYRFLPTRTWRAIYHHVVISPPYRRSALLGGKMVETLAEWRGILQCRMSLPGRYMMVGLRVDEFKLKMIVDFPLLLQLSPLLHYFCSFSILYSFSFNSFLSLLQTTATFPKMSIPSFTRM